MPIRCQSKNRAIQRGNYIVNILERRNGKKFFQNVGQVIENSRGLVLVGKDKNQPTLKKVPDIQTYRKLVLKVCIHFSKLHRKIKSLQFVITSTVYSRT